MAINEAVVERLKSGNWQFGHAGMHRGSGAPDCPKDVLHHHHDEFCRQPTLEELVEAGINPDEFKSQSRA